MTADLVAFLNARLAEDEEAALGSLDGGDGVWRFDDGGVFEKDGPVVERREVPGFVGVHIARHDPARVLADVQAKRAILAAIEQWQHDDPDDGGFYACPATRTEPLGDLGPESFGEDNCTCGVRVRRHQIAVFLAQPFAAHPDFNPAWLVSAADDRAHPG